ncbi:MAG: hypothetical protein Fur0042_12680 [Cyanophyceae cyanobacterium]
MATKLKKGWGETSLGYKVTRLEDYESSAIYCPECGAKTGHKLRRKYRGEWSAKCARGHVFTHGLKSMPSLDHLDYARYLASQYKKATAIRYLLVAVGSVSVNDVINRGII